MGMERIDGTSFRPLQLLAAFTATESQQLQQFAVEECAIAPMMRGAEVAMRVEGEIAHPDGMAAPVVEALAHGVTTPKRDWWYARSPLGAMWYSG